MRQPPRQQRSGGRPWYDNREYRKRRKMMLEEHRATVGEVCTFCGRDTGKHNPLTVDHVKARSTSEGLQVMCRRCNSSKGNR